MAGDRPAIDDRQLTIPVPNLTRATVQGGADHFPLEDLRLKIDTPAPTLAP